MSYIDRHHRSGEVRRLHENDVPDLRKGERRVLRRLLEGPAYTIDLIVDTGQTEAPRRARDLRAKLEDLGLGTVEVTRTSDMQREFLYKLVTYNRKQEQLSLGRTDDGNEPGFAI